MIKLTFLGVGSAMVTDRYNTCFLVEKNNKTMLVDCGGGHEILKQFKENNITINHINAIFVSHSHIDHILGFPFLFRQMIIAQKKMKIICSSQVKQDLEMLIMVDIPKEMENNKRLLDFMIIDENKDYEEFGFFKVNETQHGFYLKEYKENKESEESKRVIFFGDVPIKENLIENNDIIICEAFCSKDDDITITGNHNTIEEVLKTIEKKNVKKAIIIHSSTNLDIFSSEKIIIPKEKEIITI